MKFALMFIITCFLIFGLKAQENLIVFDGGDVIKGKGFALPRGISKLEVSYKHPHSNKTHLEFNGKFNLGWSGFGWNWQSWEGDGTNLNGYKNMVFHISVSPVKITDINIQLVSKNKNGNQDDMGPKVSILPEINTRGKYVKIIIPLVKLFGDNLDKTAVWGFNIGVYTDKKKKSDNCLIFIDQVEFTQ